MDITVVGLRGWREALGRDIAVPTEKQQEFSRIIEKYLVSAERHGWAVAVESMKSYIELAEAALADGASWLPGREALRWLARYLKSGPAAGDWRALFERRLRERQYAERTVETYGQWVGRFAGWCGERGVAMDAASGEHIREYLDALALDAKVRIATQHQALNALVGFYREVLGRKVEGVEDYLRARNSDRVPVVLSDGEIARLLGQLTGTERLMGELMYGGGLRLMELLRLRVKDVDPDRRQLTVRGGGKATKTE